MWGVWPTLTYAQGVLLELWGEVGGAGHAVEISLQHIPTHLKVEWVAELGWHLEGGGDINPALQMLPFTFRYNRVVPSVTIKTNLTTSIKKYFCCLFRFE